MRRRLRTIAVWNMKVGRGRRAIRGLRRLIRDTDADVVLLQEAKNYVVAIRATFPDWRVYGGPGFIDSSNCVVMVRRTIKRGKHGKVVNDKPWVFVKRGRRVQHQGRVWRWATADDVPLISIHKATNALGANRVAGREEAINLADWFDSHKGRPSGAFGDFNNWASDRRADGPVSIAKEVGGVIVARRTRDIDLGIVRGLSGTWARRGKYGSDHYAHTYRLEKS